MVKFLSASFDYIEANGDVMRQFHYIDADWTSDLQYAWTSQYQYWGMQEYKIMST